MYVTVDLGTRLFPGHVETTILHHFCRTFRETIFVSHVNVDLIHTHKFFDPQGPNNCGPRPAPKPQCIRITFQLEAAKKFIPALQATPSPHRALPDATRSGNTTAPGLLFVGMKRSFTFSLYEPLVKPLPYCPSELGEKAIQVMFIFQTEKTQTSSNPKIRN